VLQVVVQCFWNTLVTTVVLTRDMNAKLAIACCSRYQGRDIRLKIQKRWALLYVLDIAACVSCPIGVLLVISEARPEVVVNIAALG
jgi:hypothetical protein